MITDKYGRLWDFPENELCPACGQPDSCGDCNHEPLSNDEVHMLGGKIRCSIAEAQNARRSFPESHNMMKNSTGG